MSRTLRLAEQRISRPSVTGRRRLPASIIAERLAPLGFARAKPSSAGPDSFRSPTSGQSGPTRTNVAQALQNDSVCRPHRCRSHRPAGPVDSDPSPPPTATAKLRPRRQRHEDLAGRLVVAVEEFVAAPARHAAGHRALLTSDEEGPADGTVVVCEAPQGPRRTADYCIVGEPTSVGAHRRHDQERPSRHHERQAHRQRASRAHRLPAARAQPDPPGRAGLAELVAMRVGPGNAFFLPTSWQISNIHGGTGASNVIPGQVVIDFNFRFCTESTPEGLQQRVKAVLDRHGLTTTWPGRWRPALPSPRRATWWTRCRPPSGRNRPHHRAVHHRRHQRRALHRRHLPQVIEWGRPTPPSTRSTSTGGGRHRAAENIYRRTLERLHDAAGMTVIGLPVHRPGAARLHARTTMPAWPLAMAPPTPDEAAWLVLWRRCRCRWTTPESVANRLCDPRRTSAGRYTF